MTSGKDSHARPRRIFFGLLVLSYVLIHLKFEYEFWFVPESTPFAKFASAEGAALLGAAEKAYLAKSTWFLLTILLVTFRVPFTLALGIGSILYGAELWLFFGPLSIAWGSILIGILVGLEWWHGRSRTSLGTSPD